MEARSQKLKVRKKTRFQRAKKGDECDVELPSRETAARARPWPAWRRERLAPLTGAAKGAAMVGK